MNTPEVTRLLCNFCGDRFVLGEGIQTVAFPGGFTIPTVHSWRCKESLYPGR